MKHVIISQNGYSDYVRIALLEVPDDLDIEKERKDFETRFEVSRVDFQPSRSQRREELDSLGWTAFEAESYDSWGSELARRFVTMLVASKGCRIITHSEVNFD